MSEYVETREVKVTEMAALYRRRDEANRFKERLASEELVTVIAKANIAGVGCKATADAVRKFMEGE